MSISLAVKYRPNKFEDVCSQTSIVKILNQQIKTGNIKNCFLFSGPSGCGKTTLARIFAFRINEYQDASGNICSADPIEIDAASTNGVENVRNIVDGAHQRSLDGQYKVYIIDEAQNLTRQAWDALLKTIEETPKYTIFIFCTTEYHKVPVTIQNRCQQYFLTRIPSDLIQSRLKYICDSENKENLQKINYTDEALNYITKLSQGSMRLAISYLEKCRDFSYDITVDNVLLVLGDFSYDIYFKLVNAIIDKNQKEVISVIEDLYNNGNDLRLFVDLFTDFILDLQKYVIFKSFDIIKIPIEVKQALDYTVNVEEASKYFGHLLDKMLELKQLIKGDTNLKNTVQIYLINL